MLRQLQQTDTRALGYGANGGPWLVQMYKRPDHGSPLWRAGTVRGPCRLWRAAHKERALHHARQTKMSRVEKGCWCPQHAGGGSTCGHRAAPVSCGRQCSFLVKVTELRVHGERLVGLVTSCFLPLLSSSKRRRSGAGKLRSCFGRIWTLKRKVAHADKICSQTLGLFVRWNPSVPRERQRSNSVDSTRAEWPCSPLIETAG